MVVGIKDAAKLIGISIITFCAVLVCTMFLNHYIDLGSIKDQITLGQVMVLYDAQLSTARFVSIISGGCLLITSVIMLLFYIKHYIDTHKKELGILKALGYSNLKIAKSFWVFGISVFIGTAAGFCAAFIIMPTFYEIQNEDKILPSFNAEFHPQLLFFLVILPTIIFALLAILHAYGKLKNPVLEMIKDNVQNPASIKRQKKIKVKITHKTELPFLEDLKKNTIRSKKTLVFFIIFASFCFSAMTQMSFSMDELSSPMMGVMMMLIGIVLASVTLFLAITTVINGNKKTIAMMRVFGYSQDECSKTLLGGYRPLAYIGFVIGTFYQYALIKIMVDVVFKDFEGIPEFDFNFNALLISLFAFIIIYEIVMHFYSESIKKTQSRKSCWSNRRNRLMAIVLTG